MDEVDTSDLQQFVNIYLEEVKLAETNYQALLKIAINDLNAIRNQVLSKLTNELRINALRAGRQTTDLSNALLNRQSS